MFQLCFICGHPIPPSVPPPLVSPSLASSCHSLPLAIPLPTRFAPPLLSPIPLLLPPFSLPSSRPLHLPLVALVFVLRDASGLGRLPILRVHLTSPPTICGHPIPPSVPPPLVSPSLASSCHSLPLAIPLPTRFAPPLLSPIPLLLPPFSLPSSRPLHLPLVALVFVLRDASGLGRLPILRVHLTSPPTHHIEGLRP